MTAELGRVSPDSSRQGITTMAWMMRANRAMPIHRLPAKRRLQWNCHTFLFRSISRCNSEIESSHQDKSQAVTNLRDEKEKKEKRKAQDYLTSVSDGLVLPQDER
ncbi:hypothetical protein PoB_005371400 [Plakobranchus ocellatus]|uniref:Uncharacterized protein n=1 Tax=Plakobranchus ocellatus TaxID=259542 RepID=A0AAV4C933_9GAST|nr:hypothetical protein PoB_005371400 [Plakobranchus ocellatus]